MRVSADVAKAQPIDANKYMVSPAYKGFLRPYLSSKGPYNNCPNEIPIKKLDSERETCATVVFKSAAIAGNPGKYISIEKGPMADIIPRITINKNFFLPFMVLEPAKVCQ